MISAFKKIVSLTSKRLLKKYATVVVHHGIESQWSSENEGASTSDAALQTRIDIVKSRPLSLEQRYQGIAQTNLVDRCFYDLKTFIYSEIDIYNRGSTRRILKEAGRLQEGSPYFFIQPLNQAGWLVERTSSGWIISKAQKIASTNSFLRTYENWDNVSVFESVQDQNLRVSSERFNQSLISPFVYRQQLGESFLNSST